MAKDSCVNPAECYFRFQSFKCVCNVCVNEKSSEDMKELWWNMKGRHEYANSFSPDSVEIIY